MNKIVLITTALVCLVPLHSYPSGYFNKLNQCRAISEIFSNVKEGTPRKSRYCRDTKGRIERSLDLRSRKSTGRICLMEDSPHRLLNDFSCFSSGWNNGGALTCFREIPDKFIASYKSNEKLYRDKAKTYLQKASECQNPSGDTSDALWTLLPPELALISNFEFGFISSINSDDENVDSTISHGFASLDPKLPRAKHRSIEYFSVLKGGQFGTGNNAQVLDNGWSIDVDTATEHDQSLNSQLRKQRQPLAVDITDYSLSCNSKFDSARKNKLISRIHRVMGRVLEDTGFERLSESRIRRETGLSSRELIEQAAGPTPYGLKKRSNVKLSSSVRIHQLSRGSLRCTNGEEGTIMAMLTGTIPDKSVASDCGSASLIVAAFGRCSKVKRKSISGLIDDVITGSTEELIEYISRQ